MYLRRASTTPFVVAWLSIFVNVGISDAVDCQWNERLHKRMCRPEASNQALKGKDASSSGRLAPHDSSGTRTREAVRSGMASSSQGNDALCESHAKKLQKDLEVAASASRGGTTAVRNVHLIYVHVHGHIDHYYHFLHDALLTFFPLYTAFADDEGNPTISRVMLWGRQSFGSFKPIFEAVYGVRVEEVPCKCAPESCAELTTDTDPRGSSTLDAPKQLAGLYPPYFDEAIAFAQRRVLGPQAALQRQQQRAPVSGLTFPPLPRGVGRIVLIERLSGNSTMSGRGRSSSGSKIRRRQLGINSSLGVLPVGVATGSNKNRTSSHDRYSSLLHIDNQGTILRQRPHAINSETQNTQWQIPGQQIRERHSRRRRLTNERRVGLGNHLELHGALVKQFGQERVMNVALEALSFAQQVQLFSEAQVIVGQHGAGLTNVLFAKPSSLLVELCPRLHLMYQHLARHRRMAYAFQDDCGGRSWHDRINGAFPVVDIPTIVSAVEQHLSISEWERDR